MNPNASWTHGRKSNASADPPFVLNEMYRLFLDEVETYGVPLGQYHLAAIAWGPSQVKYGDKAGAGLAGCPRNGKKARFSRGHLGEVGAVDARRPLNPFGYGRFFQSLVGCERLCHLGMNAFNVCKGKMAAQ